MAHVLRHATPHFAPVTALREFVTAAVEKRQRNRLYRTTCNELRALSDRNLADLGLSRSEITRVANEVSAKPVH